MNAKYHLLFESVSLGGVPYHDSSLPQPQHGVGLPVTLVFAAIRPSQQTISMLHIAPELAMVDANTHNNA